MNIQLRFLQKAVEDRNYVSFTYENKAYKKVKPLKLEGDETLHTDNGKFDFNKIMKLTVQKDRF